jgi:RNA polymerase sigma-70 factor (ECF subfamily)
MSGQAVVISAALGDERPHEDAAARIADLFDAHQARLLRLARRLVTSPDDPADFVQETFLRAARALHRVPSGRQNEEAWLVRVLINACRDSWRRAAVRTRAALDGRTQAPPAVNPEPGILAHTMVWRALGRIAPRRRAILILYELEGAGIPAIASLLGISPVTVRWHLMMGRREMAKTLGEGNG